MDRDPFLNSPRMPFSNGTGADIPPFGLIRITGFTSEGHRIAGRPNTNDDPHVYTLGIGGLPNDSTARGDGFFEPLCVAAYDPADGTPVLGEEWGARANTHLLRKGNKGFRIAGEPDSGIVVVARVTAGGSAPALDTASAITSLQIDSIGQIHTQSRLIYSPLQSDRPVGTNTVSGTVTRNAVAASGRVVVITQAGYSWSATTNASGAYNIEFLPGGVCTVQLLAAPGESATWVQSITLPSGTPIVNFAVTA
jgi:hypothetical protein